MMRFRRRTLMILGTITLSTFTGWIVGEVAASGIFDYQPTLTQRVSVAGTIAGAAFGAVAAAIGRMTDFCCRRFTGRADKTGSAQSTD